jgi:ActR/RegA family two-component response regulator
MKEAVPMNEGEQRKRRALVIGDSMVVRKSLTRVVTKLGFEGVQAVDGMEGLKEQKAITNFLAQVVASIVG